MQKKLHIKKGDTVIVITGNYKGQKGRVLEVIRNNDRAIVEGVNLVKKHTKPNADNPQGGIIEQESSIHISNLMLVDPKTGERTRIGRRENDKGKLIR
jgi:large subunit ribosomal protein L24